MIQSVHNVLIGKQVPGSFSTVDALAKGDVAVFDENKKLITEEANAAKAKSLFIGVCRGKMKIVDPTTKQLVEKSNVEFSNEINKAIKVKATAGAFEAPVQEKIKINMKSAVITKGNRYVIRIVYKDIYEAAWQFTHTYEVIAEDTVAKTLATAFKNEINKHANRRVEATIENSSSSLQDILVLTALPKDDNEGVKSLNTYTVVNMEASLYETIPGALLSNQPKAVAGVVITKTAGKPGKGYWKQVRDTEVKNMGYKGHVFTGAYPAVEQDMMTVEDAHYDYMIIENENAYLSNDNQYIKNTPMTTEVYCPAMNASNVKKFVEAYISGEAAVVVSAKA